MKCLLRSHGEGSQCSTTPVAVEDVYIFIQACSWMSQRSEVFVAMRALRTPLLTSSAISSFCYCATVVFTIAVNAVCEKREKEMIVIY